MKRRVRLLTVEEKSGESKIVFDYAAVMLSALRGASTRGLTIGEMKDRIDAIDVIEEAAQSEDEKKFVFFTPQQHAIVVGAVEEFRFAVVIRAAVEFLEHLKHAPEAE